MSSLLLDIDTWDLVLDASGNIALASAPYAIAQDVATAVRTVLGEVYYNGNLGLDYFGEVYGKTPPAALLVQLIVNEALTVLDVVSAECVITSFSERSVTGQIQFVDTSGVTHNVSF
jgi:hypothetical protein